MNKIHNKMTKDTIKKKTKNLKNKVIVISTIIVYENNRESCDLDGLLAVLIIWIRFMHKLIKCTA